MELLTLEELNEYDIYGEFIGYSTVQSLIDEGKFNENLVPTLPTKCKCGGEIIVSKNLCDMTCCNPRCHIKIGYNLAKMYNNFGIEGIGPGTCLKMSEMYLPSTEFKSHVEFLKLELPDLIGDFGYSMASKISSANKSIEGKIMTLGELISKLGIPHFGAGSAQLFDKYPSMVEFLKEVQYYGWANIFNNSFLLADNTKKFYLREYCRDITYAILNFFPEFKVPASKTIYITLSGTLRPHGQKITKEQYMEIINSFIPVVDGRKLLAFVNNKAIKTNDYIISDEMHESAQVAKAREQYSGGKKILYSSTEFIEYLKKLFKIGEEEEEEDEEEDDDGEEHEFDGFQ